VLGKQVARGGCGHRQSKRNTTFWERRAPGSSDGACELRERDVLRPSEMKAFADGSWIRPTQNEPVGHVVYVDGMKQYVSPPDRPELPA
jgi:hypothetical protein